MAHDAGRPMTSGAPRPAELIGALLGSYRVLGKLGQGGMGEVYVGRHEALGHKVAVKVLKPELSRDADMVRRFFKEAQAAAAIRNLGIVQVFDFGTTPDGRAYFVMEMLEGDSLAARLKQRRLSYVECCRVGRQAANVLQAAHAAGITHRDLKPDNLFLIPDSEVAGGERVKVLDFGIAKVLDFGITELGSEDHSTDVRTRTGLMLGTPVYMSPEQCRGAGAVDTRADIYSLGCILFEMTCGRPPFVGEGPGEILGAHQYLEPPQPRSFAGDIPTELAQLILQMLAKHPGGRPQTMAAVGQALEEMLRVLEGAPRRAPTAHPAPQMAPRRAASLHDEPPQSASLQSAPPTLQVRRASERSHSGATRAGTRRTQLVLGGVVLAVVVIAIVASVISSGPDEQKVTEGTTPPAGKDAAVASDTPDAAQVASAPERTPDAAEPTPTPAPPAAPDTSATAPQGGPNELKNELEIECLRYQAEQKWSDLDACADRLKAMNPATAKKLKERAILETKAVPKIAAFETALRDKNLKKAKQELDGLANVTNYATLKQRYEQVEGEAVRELIAKLQAAKDADCKEYNQLLAQEKAAKPASVAAEAARQVKCTVQAAPKAPAAPPPSNACNHEELAEKGKEFASSGQSAAALETFEKAWACKQDPGYAEKAFIMACNLPNQAKAKQNWKRMTAPMKRRALMICVRNGITEDMLGGF
ncbi:MAG TPA: protein kinase [Kofleriaceae bacterium]|nr:protein kinase [Kofleriaceae bacterium]